MDIWNKVRWAKEASDLKIDLSSGAEITRLSGSSLHTCNNYLAGSCSAEGDRCLGVRLADMLLKRPCALLAHDLSSKHTALLEEHCATFEQVPIPFTGIIYYINDRQELCRVSLDTFQREVIMSMLGLPPLADVLRAVTPDGRYAFYPTITTNPAGLTLGIVRIDLLEKEWKIIFESSGFHGLQYLGGIDALLIGQRTLPDGSMPPMGIWSNGPNLSYEVLLIRTDGTLIRKLGAPFGYMTWLSETGQVVCNCKYDTQRWRQLPERPAGNMVIFNSLNRDNPRVIEAPDHLFFHIARSKCGKYVVSEAYRAGVGINGPVDIVVVNIRSGKHRVLVSDCGVRPDGAAWRQACPYMTSSGKFVVYNANPYDITHIYAARIPDGFWESLE